MDSGQRDNKQTDTEQKLLKDCAGYFKERLGFKRLFHGMRERYSSLGYLGGTVKLSPLTLEEKQALTGFLKRDYSHQKSATIQVSTVKTALAESKFGNCVLEDVLSYYFGESLVSKKQRDEQWRQQWHDFLKEFFTHMLQTMPELETVNPKVFFEGASRVPFNMEHKNERQDWALQWLRGVLKEKVPPYQLILKLYKKDQGKLFKVLEAVLTGLTRLPAKKDHMERLPVFAAQIKGDPHFLDEGTVGNQLLTAGICAYFNVSFSKGFSLEEKAELFYQAGLLKDEVSNFTLCYGLNATTKTGRPHAGFSGFFQNQEPLLITIASLSNLAAVQACGNRVFAVENPAVFSGLLDEIKESASQSKANDLTQGRPFKGQRIDERNCQANDLLKPHNISLLCLNGQPRLASIVLLNLLTAGGAIIYYAGDFDPEGLLIAQRLKTKYREQLQFWHYGVTDYQQAKSKKRVTDTRLQQLKKISDPELKQIAELLIAERFAGYQENILPLYVQDLFKDAFLIL